MAMASFPFTNNLSVFCSPTLPPNSYRHIRTDLSTEGATRAGLIAIPDHKEVSLSVDLLSNPDQVLGARDRAEPTTLTSLFINLNFGHHAAIKSEGNLRKK
jgi:hypothetical protein